MGSVAGIGVMFGALRGLFGRSLALPRFTRATEGVCRGTRSDPLQRRTHSEGDGLFLGRPNEDRVSPVRVQAHDAGANGKARSPGRPRGGGTAFK
jgi:hypothetical protein